MTSQCFVQFLTTFQVSDIKCLIYDHHNFRDSGGEIFLEVDPWQQIRSMTAYSTLGISTTRGKRQNCKLSSMILRSSATEDGSLLVKFTATGSVGMCWELFDWGNNVEIIALKRLRETYGNRLESLNEVAETFPDYEIQPDQQVVGLGKEIQNLLCIVILLILRTAPTRSVYDAWK